VVERLREMPGVAGVRAPATSQELVALDGRAALVVVEVDPALRGDAYDATVERAEAELRTLGTPRVVVGGGPLQDAEFEDQSKADLARAELLALPVVLVLLLVIFAGIVAAGLPVLIA